MHRWSRRVCEPGEWSVDGRRRLLVEGPDAWMWVAPLSELGYEVIACRGPDGEQQCPLLAFGSCATAAAADEIASELAEVTAVLREQYPLTPLHSSPGELLRAAAPPTASRRPRAGALRRRPAAPAAE